GDPQEELLGHIDLQAEEGRGQGLAQVIQTERGRRAAAQRPLQDELQGPEGGEFIAPHPSPAPGAEVGLHPPGRHLLADKLVQGVRRGEEADVCRVPFVPGAGLGHLREPNPHQPTSHSSTRTWGSIRSRGTSPVRKPKSWRGRLTPPRPPMKGGPLKARGGKSRANRAASSARWVRMAIRRKTSFTWSGSGSGAVGPWRES